MARGFGSMDPEKQKKIASLGGKAAHKEGRAHEYMARIGKLGGQARKRNGSKVT